MNMNKLNFIEGTRVIKAKVKTTHILASAIALTLAACVTPYSEAPTAKNFPTSSQPKLQAAAHWQVITDDLANNIKSNMSKRVSKDQAIYVSATGNSPFNHAVVGEIISSLVADGYNIAKSPSNAMNMDIETQVLKFSGSRSQAKRAGLASAIATGVWALAEVGTNVTAAGVATGLIYGVEAKNYINSDIAAGQTPKTEIIINVALSDAERFLAVTRGTYYVADTDSNLYQAATVTQVRTKEFKVRGD